MRFVFFAILTVPTMVLLAGAFLGFLTGQSIGLPAVFSLFPLLGFIISTALIFVFPNSKEWKIAAVINVIPLILVALLLLLFWIVGYHG